MENRPYRCPVCAKDLTRTISPDGLVWKCESCSHELMGLLILKKTVEPFFVSRLWLDAKSASPQQTETSLPQETGTSPPEQTGTSHGGACPVCAKPMALVIREALCFQICVFCEMVWMGPAEKAALPQPAAAEPVTPLPTKAVEIIAREDMRMAQLKPVDMVFESGSRHNLFWILGIPSQPGSENWKRFPWMTLVILCAIFAANGLLNLFGYTAWSSQFALWPGGVGSSLMPLFYVHGGFLNLALSAYLLFLLGTSVENKVGPFHFLAIFALPSLLGDAFSFSFGTHAGWIVGANGGVAAVFVFFHFVFPRRKIFWRFANVQAAYPIFAWFLLQCYFGTSLNNWFTGFFYSAHVGGAFCGWGYWYFLRNKLGLKREPEEGLLV